MLTFKTRGIVLKHIVYGETSLIVVVFTELFGVQQYIVKGVRGNSKTRQNKAIFFQSGALLDMVVYHNTTKALQYITDYQWNYIYENIYSSVVHNAVLTYCMELLHQHIREPECNPELFEDVWLLLQKLDKCDRLTCANLPIRFTLLLLQYLGFQIQRQHGEMYPYLDLQNGNYVQQVPSHSYYLDPALSSRLYELSQDNWETVKLNGKNRSHILQALQVYFRWHLPDFRPLKSLSIIQSILE